MTRPLNRRVPPATMPHAFRVAALSLIAALCIVAPGATLAEAGTPAPSFWSFLETGRTELPGLTVLVNHAPGAASVAACHVSLVGTSPGYGTRADPRPTAQLVVHRGGRAFVTARGRQLEQCVSIGSGELELALWHLLRAPRNLEPIRAADLDARAHSRVAALALGDDADSDRRAVLVVVGDVAEQGVVDRIRKWQRPRQSPGKNGDRAVIRSDRPPQPALRPPPPSPQSRERLSVLRAEQLHAPSVYCGWRVEPGLETAQYLSAILLASGQTSRFGFNLVYRRKLALETDAWSTTFGTGAVIGIRVALSEHASVDKMQRFFDGALTQLRIVGPTQKELHRARALFEASALRRLDAPLGRARELAQAEFVGGHADTLRSGIEAARAVDLETVRAAARTLRPVARSIVEVYPPDWPLDDPNLTGYVLYTIAAGDTWPAIAKRFGIPLARLARDNDADPSYEPVLGQPIWIAPDTTGAPRTDALAPAPDSR